MRTPQAQKVLDYLDGSFFRKWSSAGREDLVHAERFDEISALLKRARREFDSKLFFIVVFGPLKSGKSTLVNSLSREHVSPTKFAQECTRRSSVVIKSDKQGIDLYFAKADTQTGDDQAHNAFEAVIHYLRGLIEEEKLFESVRRQSVEFTPENVEHYLAADLEEEPLIVVIRSPGGKLITEEIAILDVPGLDGHLSNYETNPSSFWVVHKSDFLIFTQSSFSPLNHLTGAFLKELYVKSKKPPVWLVQNKMEARYWVDQSVRDEEAREQLRVAMKEISALIGIGESELHNSSINLGKASDGIFGPDPGLLEESHFEEFEEKLRQELDQTRINVLEQNSLNELRLQITRAEEKLHRLRREIETEVAAERAKLERLRKLSDRVEGINYQTPETEAVFAQFFQNEIEKREEKARAQAEEECIEAQETLGKQYPPKRSGRRTVRGKVINDHLSRLSERLAADVAEDSFGLRDSMGQAIGKCAKDIAEKSERLVLGEMNSFLKEQDLSAFPELPMWDIAHMPKLSSEPLTFSRYKERHWFLGFIPWPRRYPFGAVQGQLKGDLPALFMKEISSRAKSWLGEILKEYHRDYTGLRRGKLREHVDVVVRQEKQRVDRCEAQAKKATEQIDDFAGDLARLKELAK